MRQGTWWQTGATEHLGIQTVHWCGTGITRFRFSKKSQKRHPIFHGVFSEHKHWCDNRECCMKLVVLDCVITVPISSNLHNQAVYCVWLFTYLPIYVRGDLIFAMASSTSSTPGCTVPVLGAFSIDWWKTREMAMMTSSNGNIFRVTGHLCGEFAANRRIPCIKASDAELWCFLWYVPEWMVD